MLSGRISSLKDETGAVSISMKQFICISFCRVWCSRWNSLHDRSLRRTVKEMTSCLWLAERVTEPYLSMCRVPYSRSNLSQLPVHLSVFRYMTEILSVLMLCTMKVWNKQIKLSTCIVVEYFCVTYNLVWELDFLAMWLLCQTSFQSNAKLDIVSTWMDDPPTCYIGVFMT